MVFLVFALFIIMGLFFGSLPLFGPIILGFLASSINSRFKQKSRDEGISKQYIQLILMVSIICFFIGVSIGSFFAFGDESVEMGLDKMEMVYWQGGLFLLVYFFARIRVRDRVYKMSNGWNKEG